LSFIRSSNRVRLKISGSSLDGQNFREEVMKKDQEEKSSPHAKGVTRRGFLQLMGAGAAASVTAGTLAAEPASQVITPGEMSTVTLQINGRRHRLLIEPRWSLLYVIRERLGLTGTKVGCERGECGACTVLINGQARYACLMLAAEAEGTEITTLEGLMKGEDLGPVQQAFLESDAFQCGYCTPGQIMAAEGLLRANSDPSIEEIRRGMSGNLCRCGPYTNIFKAVRRAAELKRAKGGA
jgi:xanthine dehydrogenase YagT iron-sulfur-binding subunit